MNRVVKMFQAVAEDPEAYARDWKEKTNRHVIGYFCSYAPEEVMLAAGALPYRLTGSDRQIRLADSHLQAYSCSLVRSAMEDLLGGHLDFLDGTVFPHTCDSIQRLSDMWRMNASLTFHLDVVMPVKLEGASAKTYMVAVLKRFRKELETVTGACISEEKLIAASEVYNGLRTALRDIYKLRRTAPGSIGGSDLLAVTKGCMVMDRYDALGLLTDLKNEIAERKRAGEAGRKRIVLAGGLCNMPDLFDIIESAGGVVVDDDLCTGTRYADGGVDTGKEIFGALADRYLERAICPAKHAGLYKRGERLVQMVREGRADGVAFIYLKFCDPHAFDYPYLKAMLDAEGIPSMLYEIEGAFPSEGQFQTRCEAFIEML
ncbi:MAG: 2-hydroxyacyl-CoA dehydratase family protein [Deltaproteobacteria bacterium]|nr:2-hydroxyacyl-CoA dehydratase family protein [Deltaproteobacteria bacterium]